MDKGIAALIGAAALTTLTAAPPAVSAPGSELAPAMNYRALLDPVPNALSALKADDTRLAGAGSSQLAETAVIRKVQYYHHHHHHHRHYRRHHHHHHHHHHHYY
jgi:hypothetical protein